MTTLDQLAERYAPETLAARPCPLCGARKPKVNVSLVVRELRADRKGAGGTKLQKGRSVCADCAARVFVVAVEAMGYAAFDGEGERGS